MRITFALIQLAVALLILTLVTGGFWLFSAPTVWAFAAIIPVCVVELVIKACGAGTKA